MVIGSANHAGSLREHTAGSHPPAQPLNTAYIASSMSISSLSGKVHSVSISGSHVFSKSPVPSINLLENLGVEGDCHAGITDQHLYHIKKNPNKPNLRQVHFIALELLEEVSRNEEKWEEVKPGDLGENITTSGIAILELGKGTKLHFLPSGGDKEESKGGGHPVVEITGLRNPCPQIDKFRKGLQEKCVEQDPETKRVIKRKAGIMGVVVRGGRVEPGMKILIEEPDAKVPLEAV